MKIDDWVRKKDLHLPFLLERQQHVLPVPVNVQLLINCQHQEKLHSEFAFSLTKESAVTSNTLLRNQTSGILLLMELLLFHSLTQCFII